MPFDLDTLELDVRAFGLDDADIDDGRSSWQAATDPKLPLDKPLMPERIAPKPDKFKQDGNCTAYSPGRVSCNRGKTLPGKSPAPARVPGK